MWQELGEVAGRLLACTPLLYIGIVLIHDPDAVPRAITAVGSVLQNLGQTRHWSAQEYTPMSSSAIMVSRLFGAAFIAASIAVVSR